MEKKEILTIDGKEIEFIAGETILQAAERASIYIPRLCYIDEMTPYGGCRLCIVKVIGDPRPIKPSCSTPATPGMNIITIDDDLQRMRKDLIQLIISEHPNTCMVCGHKDVCTDYSAQFKQQPEKRVFGCFACSQKNDCELRDIIEYIGTEDLTHEFEYKNYDIENLDPFFERHYNLCIVCGKCVRACGELRGINAIDFYGRGHDLRISTPMNMLHLDTNCQFCGSCVDVCPTGVLVPKLTNWTRNREEYIESICNFCSVGCGLNYYIDQNKLIETVPDKKSPVNKGQACVFGRFCTVPFNFRKEPLLKTPLSQENEKTTVLSYREAYEQCKDLITQYSPEEIAVLASPDLSNESAYILRKFAADVLHTDLIGTITDGNCMEYFEELIGINRSFDNIPESDWILLIDANPQISHPVLLIPLKQAKDKKKKIIRFGYLSEDVAPETRWILDENLKLSEKEIIEEMQKFQEGKGSILIGPQMTSNILASAINLCKKNPEITLIPLRSRANLEGVYHQIPMNEKPIYDAINEDKIKLLITTERLSLEFASHIENIILLDIFPSDFSTNASIIFPILNNCESTGTFTNAELKVQNFSASIPSFQNLKSDWQILCELAKEMKIKGFRYTKIDEITKIIPKHQPRNQENKGRVLDLSDNSKTYRSFRNWKDFVFRGEKIIDRVPDLKILIDYKNTENFAILQEQREKSNVNVENGQKIDISIDSNSKIQVGGENFGLQALKSILDIAQTKNARINCIVDSNNNHFYLINRTQFCMCYNYKDSLNRSKILLEFDPHYCEVSLSIQENEKTILKPVDGLIMVDKNFALLSDDELTVYLKTEENKDKMQIRALKRIHQLLKDPTIFLTFEELDENSKLKSFPSFQIWTNGTHPTSKQSTQKTIEINQDQCIGCGTCKDVCQHDAISYSMISSKVGIYGDHDMKKANIDIDKCYRCTKCILNCPVNAISLREWLSI